jgi:hypothetical protein
VTITRSGNVVNLAVEPVPDDQPAFRSEVVTDKKGRASIRVVVDLPEKKPPQEN